jgi:hypothetical protein
MSLHLPTMRKNRTALYHPEHKSQGDRDDDPIKGAVTSRKNQLAAAGEGRFYANPDAASSTFIHA